MWLITIALGATVLYLINYWVNSYYNDWKKRGIPYSSISSPFKTLLRFFFTEKNLLDLMTEDYEVMRNHRFAGCFQLFTPGLMIRDPDLIQQICVKDFSYFVDRSLPSEVSDLFTESLGSLTGERWRTLRHKMTPTFTSGKLKMMFDPMRECCEEVVTFINERIAQHLEVRDCMFKYSINIIGSVSFGLKVNALNEETEEHNEFLKVSKMFFKPSFLLILKTLISMSVPKIRKFIKFNLVDKKVDNFFRKLVKDMIVHREKTGEERHDFLQLMLDQKKSEEMHSHLNQVNMKSNTTNPLKVNVNEPEDNELLGQLDYIQDKYDSNKAIKVFTEDSIVSQTFMFISAGSETIAAALTFILFDLATNFTYQKQLQDEVDEVISKNGFTYNAIRNMKYMEQIIYESLRLHKVGGFVARICTKNYKIPNSNVVIEKGTFISLPIVAINHDPQYFPDPEKFIPGRFEDTNTIHPGIFLPFGTGPRMCIAKRLAVLEIKMLLAAVLQHFTVVLSPKTKMPLKIQKASVLHHVDGGVWLRFKKREY